MLPRSRVVPEIDMAAAQTGSNTNSAHRTARNKIPTAIPMFSRPSCPTIYFRYNVTSSCVGDNVVEPGDIENMNLGVGILFLAVICAEILLLPVWAAAI